MPSAHVPIILLCTHDDHCCDARAKELAPKYFLLKGSGCPPNNMRAERPVPVRHLYFFPIPKSNHQFGHVRSALHYILLPPPRLSCAPVQSPAHTSYYTSSYNIMARDFRTPAVPSSIHGRHVLGRPRHVPSGSSTTGRLVRMCTPPPPTHVPE